MSVTPARPLATDLAALRAVHTGPVFLPGDEGWDEARQAWNLTADQRPAMVALPTSAADVQAAVSFAARSGLRVAPQGTGHNATAIASLENTMLVRTSELRGVEIDAAQQVARVEAGALWADVTAPASELGLAPLAGSSPDVGVVGYTLGGGLSWLGRKHGLAANHLIAADVVLSDGSAVRVDAATHPDLLWALRGGGGAFGVVTAIEFRLFPLAEVYAGMLLWPWERSEEILNAWVAWTKTTSENVTTSARILQIPPLPEIPEFLRGRSFVAIDGAHAGSEAEAAAELAPLRELGPEIDTFAMVPPAALSHVHMDPEEPMPGTSAHMLLRTPEPRDIAAIVAASGPDSGSPLVIVELRQLGGALARPGAASGATTSLPADFAFFAVGIAAGPELAAATRTYLAALEGAVERIDAGRRYSNFDEHAGSSEPLFDAESWTRLRQVKAGYDPADLFVSNHPVPPATA